MKKTTQQNLNENIAAILMLLGGFWAIYYFSVELTEMLEGINSKHSIISIDKGAFYLLGAGIGIIATVAIIVLSRYYKQQIPKKIRTASVFTLIFSIPLAFILPHFIAYPTEKKLESMGYEYCPDMSTQWLHDVTSVYVNDMKLCIEPEHKVPNLPNF